MKILVPKDLGPQPLPVGPYRVRFNGHKVKATGPNSKVPGTTMLSCEFQILTQSEDQSVKTVGRKLFENLVLNAESLWKWDQLTKVFAGVDLPAGEFTEEELIAKFVSIMTNKEAVAIVAHETYNGKVSDRVKDWKPAA